jgi:hypothetical protein
MKIRLDRGETGQPLELSFATMGQNFRKSSGSFAYQWHFCKYLIFTKMPLIGKTSG